MNDEVYSKVGAGIYTGYVYYKILQYSEDDEAKSLYNLVNQQLRQTVTNKNRSANYLTACNRLREMAGNEFSKEILILKTLMPEEMAALAGFDYQKVLEEPALFSKFIEMINSFQGIDREKFRQLINNIINASEVYQADKRNNGTILDNITKHMPDFWTKLVTKIFGEGDKNKKVVISAISSMNDQEIIDYLMKEANIYYKEWLQQTFTRELGRSKSNSKEKELNKSLYTVDEFKKIYNSVGESFRPIFEKALQFDTFIKTTQDLLKKEQTTEDKINLFLKKIHSSDSKDKENGYITCKSVSKDNLGEIVERMIASVGIENFLKLKGENKDMSWGTEEVKINPGPEKPDSIRIVFKREGFSDSSIQEITKLVDDISKGGGSIREKANEMMSKVTALLPKDGKDPSAFLVHTNMKNYQVDAKRFNDFKGFSTGAVTGAGGLSYLEGLYSRIGRSQDGITLAAILRNLGDNTVGDNNTSIKTFIEHMIGADVAYALFDDAEAIGADFETGGGQIHLLDLNFITVPLSFYLFRLADAFEKMAQDISQNPDELVYVKANPKPAKFSERTIQMEANKEIKKYNKTEEGKKNSKSLNKVPSRRSDFVHGSINTMKLWEDQKAYSDSGEILEIHFLHSFSQIIQEFL